MNHLTTILARALIDRNTVTIMGCDFEVCDFRLEVMAGSNDIVGEIVLLDKGNNCNKITIDILIKGNKNEPTRYDTDAKEDAPF